MKQILVIVPFPMSDENLQSRKAQLAAVELSPNLNFTFRPVKAAPRNYVSQADMVMADIGILEAGLSAEEEGFDAVCIDTMSDSGVAALRSILRIPVVGPGRVAMLEAMMLGSRFSIVTMWQKWRHLYEKTISDLGISHALASVRSIDVAPDNQALLGGREDDIFPLLEAAARQAIEEDRAEVIILGSTTMHQAHAHLVAALDVPVINPGPLTYKTVESLLSLGLSHSLASYPKSLVSRNEMIKSMLAAANKFEH
ncbi:MAG: aspartate/glutamate racemase family protein [Proteobacteria bacterium]|jgi:allantoin racemase|nr:aspartate/glutamate racemase family protein [Pseudomonadota bacterium]MDA1149163.1 aspartate/glutamate racemase family protein [Pseudomonadota bacterium]